MKAKVIHIDTGTSWRGGQQQAVYLYENMLEKGYQSTFFTKKNSKVSTYFHQKGIECHSLPMLSELDVYSAWQIAHFAKKHHYNLLHCHCSHSVAIGLIASMINSKLRVVATRRVAFHIRQTLGNEMKYNHKHLAKIICISNAIRNILLSDGIEDAKLMVIRSGIKLDKFVDSVPISLSENQDEISIGTIASLTNEKDYPTLLAAAAIVCSKHKNVKFYSLGSGSMLEEMKQKAEMLGLSDKFTFLGHKKNVGDYLKAFDIFVLASKKEGLGTSILDAMSVGLPIVGSNVGGIPEAVSNNVNGLLFEKLNPESLASALLTLIENPELRRSYGEKSKELIVNFDIQKTVEQNINLYHTILGDD